MSGMIYALSIEPMLHNVCSFIDDLFLSDSNIHLNVCMQFCYCKEPERCEGLRKHCFLKPLVKYQLPKLTGQRVRP